MAGVCVALGPGNSYFCITPKQISWYVTTISQAADYRDADILADLHLYRNRSNLSAVDEVLEKIITEHDCKKFLWAAFGPEKYNYFITYSNSKGNVEHSASIKRE